MFMHVYLIQNCACTCNVYQSVPAYVIDTMLIDKKIVPALSKLNNSTDLVFLSVPCLSANTVDIGMVLERSLLQDLE